MEEFFHGETPPSILPHAMKDLGMVYELLLSTSRHLSPIPFTKEKEIHYGKQNFKIQCVALYKNILLAVCDLQRTNDLRQCK